MDTRNAQSPADRLILATIELVGRNVDVHARDGSVFTGIFYTASFEKEYGLVLKNARMTRKGKSSANVTEGVPVSILVIQPDDFVQVVAKKDELPSKGIAGNVAGNDVQTVAHTSSEFMATTPQKEEHINQTRQTGNGISQRECDGYSEEIVDHIEEGSSLQLDSSGIQVDEGHVPTSSSSSVVDVASSYMIFHSSAAPTELVPPKGSVYNKSSQESKLNPEAQNFAPSFTKSEAEIPANTDMAHIPNYHAAARPQVGVGPCAYQYSVPGNGNGNGVPQFSQPAIRHIQPVRLSGQYPPYVHPNSPHVMAAGPYEYPVGQHPYMQQQPYPYVQYPCVQQQQHPNYGNVITYDVVHGTAAIPPPRLAVNPYQQLQYPKNQGQALQLCMPPSIITGAGQQRITVPTHFSLLQSRFSANRRIPIPASNALFTTKLS